ncbi:MAG: hypothetical protein WBC71_05750 [Salaquimonas sp.]
MAYQNEYERPDGRRINYNDLEQSSISSRGILIALGIIAIGLAALFIFGEVSMTVDPATTSQTAPPAALEQTPVVPETTPVQ